MPSHLTSCTHSSPAGTRSATVASIGRSGACDEETVATGPILPTPARSWVLNGRPGGRLSAHLRADAVPTGLTLGVCADREDADGIRERWRPCERSGRARSPSGWSTCRCGCTPPPRTTTCTFHQVHREDGGRIKYQRTCSIDGEEVSYDDIAKGYETEDGDMVVLTDEDFAELPANDVQRDRGRRVRPRRPDRPDPARQVVLPRARQDRDQAVRPAARRAARPSDRMAVVHGRAPHPRDDGGAAGARRRHRHADDAVARRGARRRLRGLTEDAARHQAGDGHGQDAHRPAGRRLRARRATRTTTPSPSRSSCAPRSRAARCA